MALVWLLVFFIVGGGLLLLFFNGLFYGAMYMAIPPKRLKKLMELSRLTKDMTVYDLGAGYGRIMFEAAKSGAYVVGYEIDWAKAFWIKQEIKKKLFTSNSELNVAIRQENLLDADLSEADVVLCYLSPPLMQRLGEKAKKEMRAGSRLISVEHKIPFLIPSFEDVADKIYMYTF